MKLWKKPSMLVFSNAEIAEKVQAAACSHGFYCIGGFFR